MNTQTIATQIPALEPMTLLCMHSEFRYPNPCGYGQGLIDVRIYAGASSAAILMIEDGRNYSETSVTNASSVIAKKIMIELLEPLLNGRGQRSSELALHWIEVYATSNHQPPTFDFVNYAPGLCRPTWKHSSQLEVEGLIAQRISGLPYSARSGSAAPTGDGSAKYRKHHTNPNADASK